MADALRELHAIAGLFSSPGQRVLATIAVVIGGIVLFLSGVAGLLTIVFSIAATFKAIFGSAWPYPFAPDLIGRLN